MLWQVRGMSSGAHTDLGSNPDTVTDELWNFSVPQFPDLENKGSHTYCARWLQGLGATMFVELSVQSLAAWKTVSTHHRGLNTWGRRGWRGHRKEHGQESGDPSCSLITPLTVSMHWSKWMSTRQRGDSKEGQGYGKTDVDSEAEHLPFLLTPGLGFPTVDRDACLAYLSGLMGERTVLTGKVV